MPSRRIRKIQFGGETTAGTAVVADTIYRGTGLLTDAREVVMATEDVGFLPGVTRAYTRKLEATMALDAVAAATEFLPVVFSCGIAEDTSGEADGTAGSGKIYTFVGATNASPTLSACTLEMGDASRVDEMEYSFVTDFEISGEAGGELMLASNWVGRQATDAEFTALTLADVHELMFSQGTLYIDDVDGTIGSTPVSATLLGMKLNVTTGAYAQYGASGALYFEKQGFGIPEVMLELTYEHNASAITEITAWRNKTSRQMRLSWSGDALGTAGTAYSYHTLQMDMAGIYESCSTLGEQDGNDTVTCTMRVTWDPTAALFFETIVVNVLAAW